MRAIVYKCQRKLNIVVQMLRLVATRRDSAHPKLYGKEYGTYGRQPARARMREDASIIPECLPILYPPEILPHQKQGILPTTVFVALHTLKCLDGLVAIEYSQTVRHLSVNRNSSTAFSNCQRIQICGDMTCLLYMVCLRPSFIVLYTDNLLSPGSIHYLNDRVITMSLCYAMYAFWLKPPSLPNAAYNGNAGRNWNCGPMRTEKFCHYDNSEQIPKIVKDF
ncbi:hypothetical protein B0H19DRAFT_1074609 [Mycena capillaripes]|nr:hypothetical protein B0H19DRAFT_1074609 [Mycena capillaripes]